MCRQILYNFITDNSEYRSDITSVVGIAPINLTNEKWVDGLLVFHSNQDIYIREHNSKTNSMSFRNITNDKELIEFIITKL